MWCAPVLYQRVRQCRHRCLRRRCRGRRRRRLSSRMRIRDLGIRRRLRYSSWRARKLLSTRGSRKAPFRSCRPLRCLSCTSLGPASWGGCSALAGLILRRCAEAPWDGSSACSHESGSPAQGDPRFLPMLTLGPGAAQLSYGLFRLKLARVPPRPPPRSKIPKMPTSPRLSSGWSSGFPSSHVRPMVPDLHAAPPCRRRSSALIVVKVN